MIIKFDDKVIDTHPLYALNSIESGGFFKRSKDAVRLAFKHWFG